MGVRSAGRGSLMCHTDDLSLLDLSAVPFARLLALQDAVFDAIAAHDVASLSADAVTGCLHAVELVRHRQTAFDHRLVAALTEQITIGAVPVRSAKDFLIDALRVAPGEAA